MKYTKIVLEEEFELNSIIIFHYFEFAKDYVYEG